ncbi:hypothetical protein ACHAXR_010390 [Thalassiosira sp. AJA248-18]
MRLFRSPLHRHLPLLGAALSLSAATSPTGTSAAAAAAAHQANNFTRWNISGAAARKKAAFVSDSPALPGFNKTTPPPRRTSSSNPIRVSSMKRAPSPPAAFTSSIKRSFGLSSATSLTMSTKNVAANTKSDNTKSKKAMTPPLYNFRNSFSHSWIQHLSPEDPENYEKSLTRGGSGRGGGGHPGRPVFNGHYVSVRPTPLKNPTLVIHSPEVLSELGFQKEEALSEPFVKYFSGDVDGAFSASSSSSSGVEEKSSKEEKEIETWATPYALSIMGKRYTNNCPYGTGDGYGDGRAVSVGEIVVPHDNDDDDDDNKKKYPHHAARYELQLKGAGQTPFCRGADGRAVLRSSIREFLASEAMHHLGISTTRALSLIVSESPGGNTSTRPWYSEGNKARGIPSMDDPRLAKYDVKQRKEILSQLAVQAKSDPDMLVEEKCAITTRVASSFVRIGHLDLFARRVDMLQMKDDNKSSQDNVKETQQYQELEDMMWHACYREYYVDAYEPYWEEKDAKSAAVALMEGAMTRISDMIGGWIRVGFVQGNFNADNCLVGGRTMDYGPFGFLDVYHPLSAKWTGSGEHFGFMNQPNAGYANFAVLVESLLPIIDANGGDSGEVRDEMLKKAQSVFSDAVDTAMRAKMGLDGSGSSEMDEEADELWGEIEPLLRIARGDWTLFWRQLTYVAAKFSPTETSGKDKSGSPSSDFYDSMVEMLLGESDTNPFYDALTDENRASLRDWIEKWHKALTKRYSYASELSKDVPPPEERMRLANPKYTLREWMLVEAYSKADSGKSPGNPFSVSGDYSGVHDLFELCKDPYSEGSAEHHKKYYRRAPDESLRAGGIAFMS